MQILLGEALCYKTPSFEYRINRCKLVYMEKAMAPHSSTLAWRIPWTEKPGRLQSMGSRRVRHDWATSLSVFTFMHWRRKWQPTPVFLPGESQGWGSLVGCRLWGRRVRHDWNDLVAAAAYIGRLHNKVLLYSTGKYIRYPVINQNGKEYVYYMFTYMYVCSFYI